MGNSRKQNIMSSGKIAVKSCLYHGGTTGNKIKKGKISRAVVDMYISMIKESILKGYSFVVPYFGEIYVGRTSAQMTKLTHRINEKHDVYFNSLILEQNNMQFVPNASVREEVMALIDKTDIDYRWHDEHKEKSLN